MNNTAKVLTVCAVLHALSSLLAQAQPAQGGPRLRAHRPSIQGPGGEQNDTHRSQPGPRRQEILKQYDANGDGTLDETERATLHADMRAGKVQPPAGRGFGRRGSGGPDAELVKKYDANGDGVLDATERDALHADIQAGKVERPMGRGPRGPGGPGGRGPNPELVKQYDANGDGVLDETERAALRADVQSGKIERPMHRRERRGPDWPPADGQAEPAPAPPE
jgi:hypothetical protein